MRSIQSVGVEILSENPASFYVFVGSEYGIKKKYIDTLEEHYGEKVEADTVGEVFKLMRTKSLLHLKPKLYIIRYDEEFISKLNANTEKYISRLNIVGTIVCIYEKSTHTSKLEKYLPAYTVSIDSVDSRLIKKYLHNDFPRISDRILDIISQCCDTYGQAYNVCSGIAVLSDSKIDALTQADVLKLFRIVETTNDADIKIGVASRNAPLLLKILSKYPDDKQITIFNLILSTMVELEKLLIGTNSESGLRRYVNRWTMEDVYNMFMHTYAELKKSRSGYYNISNGITYLVCLLKFSKIPDCD